MKTTAKTKTAKKTMKIIPGSPFAEVDVRVGEPGQLTPEEFETLAAISAAVFARRPNCVRMTLSMFLDRNDPDLQDPQRVSVIAMNACGRGTVDVVERYSPRGAEGVIPPAAARPAGVSAEALKAAVRSYAEAQHGHFRCASVVIDTGTDTPTEVLLVRPGKFS